MTMVCYHGFHIYKHQCIPQNNQVYPAEVALIRLHQSLP